MSLRAEAGNVTNITAAAPTTTQVKLGRGVLKRVVVGTPANTGTITIYDNTGSDTTVPVAIITSKTADPPFSLEFNCKFSNGLKVVTATAAQNVSVVWE